MWVWVCGHVRVGAGVSVGVSVGVGVGVNEFRCACKDTFMKRKNKWPRCPTIG